MNTVGYHATARGPYEALKALDEALTEWQLGGWFEDRQWPDTLEHAGDPRSGKVEFSFVVKSYSATGWFEMVARAYPLLHVDVLFEDFPNDWYGRECLSDGTGFIEWGLTEEVWSASWPHDQLYWDADGGAEPSPPVNGAHAGSRNPEA